jgi:hypothetical protein
MATVPVSKADASSEDMQNQEREPHLFPSFIIPPLMQVGCEDGIRALPG